MGNSSRKVSVKHQLSSVRERVEGRLGKAAVTGRYHTDLALEDAYTVHKTRVLGMGMNGSVIMGSRKTDNFEVAIKPYTSVGISKEEQRCLRNEVEIFLSLDHPHIARLVDVYEEADQLWLVMEVCSGGEVLTGIQKLGRYDESTASALAYQMLLAVNYLHDRHIVHRDLKLENFLFEDKECKHLKLIDFGMSRYWTNNVAMKVFCGTLPYMAPECLQQHYTIKCDMWSLGVCVFVLLSGTMPFFGSESEQRKSIASADYSLDGEEWANVSDKAKDFVRQLLCKDIDARLSAEEALKHPWIVERQNADGTGVDDITVKSLQKFANASAFRRLAFTMMSYSMPLDDRKKVRQAFLAIDTDHTGKIQMTELLAVLKEHGIASEQAEKMLAALDANDDNTVYYAEFLAAMMTDRIARSEKYVRAAFNRLDRDNTGFITLENLKDTVGSSYDGIDVSALLKEVDTHHSGSISYEEFMEYLQGGDAEEAHQEAVCRLAEREKSLESAGVAAPAVADAPPAAPAPSAAAVAKDQCTPPSENPAAQNSACCSVM
eukprot:TRINITY_DN77904_c0_g1_i1.p1 TRINITY_DN77904_c0_g1~~TRINITY_DN77904_c0_g1_i1.p1  ORF type:complete len:547 (+),score=114.70 TRINITY_DN77904_c0_g1_i1:47-1687(+)